MDGCNALRGRSDLVDQWISSRRIGGRGDSSGMFYELLLGSLNTGTEPSTACPVPRDGVGGCW